MIVNLDGLTSSQEEERIALIGKPYSFFEKISLGGVGSSKLIIAEASQAIHDLLDLNTDANFANIELGRAGIQVGFRSKQNAFAWIIPYRKLSIFKNSGDFAIHADGMKVKLVPHLSSTVDYNFLKKLQRFKSNYFESVKGPLD